MFYLKSKYDPLQMISSLDELCKISMFQIHSKELLSETNKTTQIGDLEEDQQEFIKS